MTVLSENCGFTLIKNSCVDKPNETPILATLTTRDCRFRILVAEDNPINQRVITLMLRGTGFEVDVVADGKLAVAAQRSQPYHLILMDLQMPGIDGWEATRRIRMAPGIQPVIVAVTANAMPGTRERCLAAGINDYLPKPFNREQLLLLVREIHNRLASADTMCKAS